MTDTQSIFSTPVLIGRNKQDREKYWQGHVIAEGLNIFTYTYTSEVLASGEIGNIKTSDKTRVIGKNKGKKNETSDTEQAIFDISVAERKLRDVGYTERNQAMDIPILPMLAENFKDRQNTIVFPCALQPKYNGNRAVHDVDYYKFMWWTRKGKGYKPEITAHLDFDCPFSTDGELMLPFPKYKLADIASVCKKYYGREFDPSTLDLSYHIFDIVDLQKTFKERHEQLTKWYNRYQRHLPESIYLVPTYNCEDMNDVEHYFRIALRKGFEGIVLRNWEGIYLPGWYDLRSTDLMKLKPHEDGEYEIVGCKDGTGKESEAIMYTCKTTGGLTFDVHPEGPIPARKKLWYDYCVGTYNPVGKMYTIRYQELSKDDIPQHAVGVAVRDYE